MAAPVFLSYAWDDMAEVDDLDSLLRFRGVPVWRDRREMRWGGYNEDLVRAAILEDVSGFAVYLTPAALNDSWFIPKVELRAMDDRRAKGDAFFSGAIFRGYGVDEGKTAAKKAVGIDLGATLGTEVDEAELLGDLREAANGILLEYLRAHWRSGPASLHIETRDPLPTAESSLLHLALSPPLAHDPDEYDVAVWGERIQPAFDDLQKAFHTIERTEDKTERTLEVEGASHLSAAVALGYAFREPTRWNLRIRHFDAVWATERSEGDLEGWECPPGRAGSDPDGDLVVMIHATADVQDAVRASASGPIRAELHFRPENGPGKLSLDPKTANGAAAGIAKAIRDARRKYAPSETRLYMAAPWPFAALLGWHLGSTGAVVMHEANVERDSYRVSCVLK